MTWEKRFSDIMHHGFDEFRMFVNPMIARRAAIAGEPVRLVQTTEGHLVDREGQAIEDMHGVQALGHRNAHVARAVSAYIATDHPSWYPSRVNPYGGRLARVLHERTGYDSTFFALSGSEVVEAAIKLARAATKRTRIVGLANAYHGCTMGSCALMQQGPFRDPFGPHLPDVESVHADDTDSLLRTLAAGDVAAVVVEPIQVEGGMHLLSESTIQVLCEATERYGTLLVADEVQTGLGRTGHGLLTSSRWPRKPDVVLLGKTLGGGLVPISAMLSSRTLFMQAYGADFATGEAHNTTFSNNALGCVAALATLDLLDEALFARIRTLGARFRDDLVREMGDSPLLADIRGDGFMIGIELRDIDHPWLSYEHFGMPELAGRSLIAPLLANRLYRRGFYIFSCGHDWKTLRLQPRFDIPEATLDRFVTACAEELRGLADLA